MTTAGDVFRCGHPKDSGNTVTSADGRGRPYTRCRTCQLARERDRKARLRAERGAVPRVTATYAGPKFPVAPLLTYLQRHEVTDLHEADGRAVERARQSGWVSLYVADRIACTVGTHPGLIWPEWFDVEVVA